MEIYELGTIGWRTDTQSKPKEEEITKSSMSAVPGTKGVALSSVVGRRCCRVFFLSFSVPFSRVDSVGTSSFVLVQC